jgi:phage terminase large subunit-like protein
MPFGSKKLAEDLFNVDGLPVESVRQGYLSLSDPTKTLHELIKARKIRHGGHPIVRWRASNAVARTDAAGNIKLDKEKWHAASREPHAPGARAQAKQNF